MLIFDFDGVLVDSLDEACLTAYNAATNQLKTTTQQLPQGYVTLFKSYRYHVLPAGDFIPFAGWCLANADNSAITLSREEYRRVVLQPESTALKERTARFYAARASLVELDKSHWLAMNSPYEPLWSVLKKKDPASIVILTN